MDRVNFDIRMATGEECRDDVKAVLSAGSHQVLNDLKLLRKELSFDGKSMSIMQQHRFDLFHDLKVNLASQRAWGVRHWQLSLAM